MTEPTFALKTQEPPLRPALGVLGVLVLTLTGLALGASFMDRLPAAVVVPAGAVIGLVLGVLLWPRLTRRLSPPPIVVGARCVSLPRSVRARDAMEIPLEEILSVEARGKKGAPLLVLGTQRGFFLFPMKAFVDADGPVLLRDALRAAIAARPDGPTLLEAMKARELRGVELTQRKTWATWALLAVIGAVYVVETAAGAPASPVATLRLGANAPFLVLDGQWWRLFTAGFMHLSLLHIALNGSALMSFGAIVEKLLGSWRFLVVVLCASLAGNLASMITRAHLYSAGASSLLFGLVGALLVINLKHRASLPAGFFLGARRWVWLLGVNGMVSLLPGVDGLAHLGGLAAGSVLTFFLVPVLDVDPPQPHPIARGAAVLLLAAFLVAFGVAGVRGVRLDDQAALLDLVRAELHTTSLPADIIHRLTTALAADPTTERSLLDEAREAQQHIVEKDPANGAYRETLLQLDRRLRSTSTTAPVTP